MAAVNQAIADGVVDVINYSIGGGASPWSEAVSLAFLNAVVAAIALAMERPKWRLSLQAHKLIGLP